MQKVRILNIEIDNLTKNELLAKLKDGGVVFTPNVDHLIKLQKDPDFYHVYNCANYRTCDSQILMFVARFLGTPIVEKISGSDFFPAFYNYYKNDEEITIFLLGGSTDSIVELARKKINDKVGRNMVVATYSPPFGFEKSESESQKIVDLINESGATVLAVGVGAPKQEKWIFRHKALLKDVKVFLAIGATIEFEAGTLRRSPPWMSNLGLEWLYRLLSEPKRLAKRYLLEDLPFFWLILLQKLNLYKYKMPIGQILMKAGLISEYQLAIILQAQKEQRKLRFGEILVLRGWLKPETIDFFADQFPILHKKGEKQPLGYYLKAASLLTDEQIALILKEQGKIGLKFGEIAVKKGWIKEETINLILESLEIQQPPKENRNLHDTSPKDQKGETLSKDEKYS